MPDPEFTPDALDRQVVAEGYAQAAEKAEKEARVWRVVEAMVDSSLRSLHRSDAVLTDTYRRLAEQGVVGRGRTLREALGETLEEALVMIERSDRSVEDCRKIEEEQRSRILDNNTAAETFGPTVENN